jgi:hypothetical protein
MAPPARRVSRVDAAGGNRAESIAARMEQRSSIELFLSPAGERGQTLARGLGEGALVEAAPEVAKGSGARPLTSPDPGGDPSSLRDQGWGVIAPRGEEGDRLLALIRPLLEQRAADQDGEVAEYRVPPDLTAVQAAQWIDRKLIGNELQAAIPGYLLVLGGPEQVSFELQQALAFEFNVGRLGFSADPDKRHEARYEAYVEKLLRAERAPEGAARATYFTVRDGTAATELGHRMLMQPCIADAEAQRAAGRFPVSELAAIEEHDPVRAADRWLAAAAGVGPGVLFSCSHGVGAPRDGWKKPELRRELQGAPCLGGGQHLEAEVLARSPFVPNGVWLMFACFGAGTPRISAYHHWLRRLQAHGEHADDLAPVKASLPGDGEPPFLAKAAQAALANPAGPLAIISHLDLAWSYGFCDLEKMSQGERHRRFYEVVAQLVKGTRVGLAMDSLRSERSKVRAEIMAAVDAEARGEAMEDHQARLGHRWMMLQDLDGYVALGDPAARLQVARAQARKRGAAAAAPAPERSGAVELVSAPASASAPGIDPGAIQRAVHELIAGRATAEQLATTHGVAPAIVEEWRRVYTEAGLRAVAALVAATRGGNGGGGGGGPTAPPASGA